MRLHRTWCAYWLLIDIRAFQITAFELSPGRHRTLVSLLTTSGAKQANVETVNGDFLATDPENEQWKDVQYILVDPSCSGSGIVNRMD